MEFKETFFDTGEIRLHVMEGPRNGPPLVLLHGATGTWKGWVSILPQLTQDWQVYALDLRGHGQSDRAPQPGGYHLSRNVADLAAFLRGGLQAPAVVMGHSWGAVITFLSGGAAKDWLRAMVLEDPPLAIRRRNKVSKPYQQYFAWLGEIKAANPSRAQLLEIVRQGNPNAPDQVLEAMAESMEQVDAAFLASLLVREENTQGIDFGRAAREIACPALLLQADPAMGAALVDFDIQYVQRHNPRIELARFTGVGHGIHDGKPQEMLAALDAFTKRHPL